MQRAASSSASARSDVAAKARPGKATASRPRYRHKDSMPRSRATRTGSGLACCWQGSYSCLLGNGGLAPYAPAYHDPQLPLPLLPFLPEGTLPSSPPRRRAEPAGGPSGAVGEGGRLDDHVPMAMGYEKGASSRCLNGRDRIAPLPPPILTAASSAFASAANSKPALSNRSCGQSHASAAALNVQRHGPASESRVT